MPRVLDDLQRFEEDRADKMKEWFLRVVSTQEAIPPAVATSSQNMRSITEAIDRPSDITNFIRENTTGTPKPEEAKYVPYNEGPATGAATVRRDNSRMTIAPMTSSPVTTSSNGRASLAFTSTSQSSFGSPSGPIVQPSAPAASPAVKQEKQLVRALYNYDATEDTELSFKANDMITVLQKDDSGWWQGELNGAVGMFPMNFVDGSNGGSGGGITPSAPAVAKTAPSEGGSQQCKVLYNYNADSDSELTIKEGDLLTIESEDEGWFFGFNSRGESGRFPSNYVQTM